MQSMRERRMQVMRVLETRHKWAGLGALVWDTSAAGYQLKRYTDGKLIGPRLTQARWVAWAEGFLDGWDYREHTREVKHNELEV